MPDDILWSWSPADDPAVDSHELRIDVATHVSGWQTALSRPPRIKTSQISLDVASPGAITLPISPPAVRTRSFFFPEADAWQDESPADPATGVDSSNRRQRLKIADEKPTPQQQPAGRTRIAPPRDIIKLEDRLHYLLQPSLESLLSQGSLSLPFPPFPYQLDGIAFLYPRHAAILADEMGLGKTMQAITAIRLLLHAGELRRVLVICPKPLVTNWQRELAMWAPEIPVSVVEGDQHRRLWQWRETDVPVKIANYELVVRDRDVLAEADVNFDLVVLDEAQRIKNRSGATHHVVSSINRQRSWALTGTPVENSPEDLVSIFEFLSPGFLCPSMKPRRMGRAIGDYTLRRTKDKVLKDLPPKLYRDAELDLTPEQRVSYSVAEDEGVLRLSEMGEAATIQHVFELVLRLKQICNFDPVTGASAKYERLNADLEEVAASGKKAVVFSQWTKPIAELSRRLERFGPLEYHGKIPSRKRDGVIAQFRDDPNCHVMLMSYGAGAVGLNLQFAGYVFLFDRWWNPAVEDQAINRCHRIGVTGPVTVTRFLSLHTIEERIDQILQEKREIFDAIFSTAECQQSHGLNRQEIFGLFNLKTSKGPIDLAA